MLCNKAIGCSLLFVAAGTPVFAGDCTLPTRYVWFPDDYECTESVGKFENLATRFGSQGKWKFYTFAPGWSIQRVNPSQFDFFGNGLGAGSTSGTNCDGEYIVDVCGGPSISGYSYHSSVYGEGLGGYGADDQGCPGSSGFSSALLAQETSQVVEILICSSSYSRPVAKNQCLDGGCSTWIANGAYATAAVATPTYEIVGPRGAQSAAFTIDAKISLPALAELAESTSTSGSTAISFHLRRIANGQVVENIDTVSGAFIYDSGGNLSYTPNLSQDIHGDWVADVSGTYNLEPGTYRVDASIASLPDNLGDVNGDTLLTLADVTALQALVGQSQPTPNGYPEYNFDGSGINSSTITQSDVDALERFVVAFSSAIMLGDTDSDGIISCTDAAGFSVFSSSFTVGDVGYLINADIDRNGILDGFDEVLFNSVYYPVVPGDVNRDGNVDLTDLNYILANFGPTNSLWSNGDLNGNGAIDLPDLNLVQSNMGFMCP